MMYKMIYVYFIIEQDGEYKHDEPIDHFINIFY